MTVLQENQQGSFAKTGETSEQDGSEPHRKFTTTQKLCLAMLSIVEFMSFCSMSIMAPFYPRESSLKGMSASTSGFVFSFYALVMFVSSPPFGKLLPKVGVKLTFVAGILVAGVPNAVFGTLHYIDDYYWFTVSSFVLRGVEALGTSAYSNAAFVLVCEIFPHNGGAVRGLMETCVGLGLSVGPALGGLLYSIGGFGLPFYVIGFGMILLVPLNMAVIPRIENQPRDESDGSFRSIAKIPQVLVICAIIVVVSITWSFLDPTLEPHLSKFQLTPGKVGLIFLLLSAMYGIFSPGWGWLTDKLKNYHWLMPAGLLCSFASLLLLGPSPVLVSLTDSLWLNILALSLLGIFVAMALMPTFQGLLDASLESGFGDGLHTQSLISGLWSCSYSLGEVIGPAMGGALLEKFDFPTTATTMAFINLLTAIVSGVYFFHRKAAKVECERVGEAGRGVSIMKANSNEFSIFTIEDKLVAKSGSIVAIKN